MPAKPGAAELTLRELEEFDGRAPARAGQRERRFLCPFPACSGKRPNAYHRSLSVDTATGEFFCHRCDVGGILREYRGEDTRGSTGRRRGALAMRRAIALPVPPEHHTSDQSWRRELKTVVALAGTYGAAYTESRRIPMELAHRSGVRYCPDFFGRAAVMFPVRSADGKLVAVNARHIDPRVSPKCRTAGPKRLGIFGTPGALDAPVLFVTEAPLDALSVAACGHPAIALVGTVWPEWLPNACAFKHVAIGLDADDAGDQASERIAVVLRGVGARCTRVRPHAGMKDWNAMLQAVGIEFLRIALDHALGASRELAAASTPAWVDDLTVPLPPELDPFSDEFIGDQTEPAGSRGSDGRLVLTATM